MIKTDAVKHKIKTLPNEPGVYQMKDRQGIVIYVGKAKNLKNRVSTYFRKQAYDNFKTKALVKEIHDFEILITRTELEALLSERTLIRTHNPKFNVLLRDDREYPYVRINLNDDWPRLEKVRSRKDDGGLYIGPFPNSSQLGLTLKTIFKIFPLIRCSRHEFANAKRPCNYYHMNMCLGPCVLDVEKKHYAEMIQKAIKDIV